MNIAASDVYKMGENGYRKRYLRSLNLVSPIRLSSWFKFVGPYTIYRKDQMFCNRPTLKKT